MKSIILIAVTVACLTGCLRDSNRFIPWVMLLDMEVYLDDKLVLHNSFQVAENTRAVMSDAHLIGFYNKFFSSVADHDLPFRV